MNKGIGAAAGAIKILEKFKTLDKATEGELGPDGKLAKGADYEKIDLSNIKLEQNQGPEQNKRGGEFEVNIVADKKAEGDEAFVLQVKHKDWGVVDSVIVVIDDSEDRATELNKLNEKGDKPKEEEKPEEAKEEEPKPLGEQPGTTMEDIQKKMEEEKKAAANTENGAGDKEMDYKSAMLTLYRENKKLRAKLKKKRK